jgi:hypothetical protein
MIPLNLDAIYDFLIQNKFEVKKQEETNQLYLVYKIHDQDTPLFLRVMDDGQLLQLLAFMPINLDPKTMSDLSRLLHLFNKEIDIPGFGIDEASKVSFFRIVLPAVEGKISGDIITGYLNSMRVVAETFFPVIVAVVTGNATFEDIFKKATTIKP